MVRVQVFVPYCSSDVYTGTRTGSALTDNFTFHGHHIFEALTDHLLATTGLASAEQVLGLTLHQFFMIFYVSVFLAFPECQIYPRWVEELQ